MIKVPVSVSPAIAFHGLLAGLLLTGIVSASDAQPAELAGPTALESVEQRLADALAELEILRERLAMLEDTPPRSAERDDLERRIEELEAARRAQEGATRRIIRDALDTLGSRINEFVVLGGTFEMSTGRFEGFDGLLEIPFVLNTMEFDFEIQVGDWSTTGLVLEYLDGTDYPFRSVEGDETFVDRINVDTVYLRLGDPQRFWASATIGQVIAPFGISTGDPVADVLTLEDPLTVEMFEMKEAAIVLEASFPTPAYRPSKSRPGPPPVRPKFLAPAVGRLARALGYKPYPARPPKPNFVTDAPPPPPFSLALYTFNGVTFERPKDEENWTPTRHVGATAGFEARGNPWSIDFDVAWTSSVFDSDLLGFEYRFFLDQIGFVPGMSSAIRAGLGPVGIVGEWNGALEHTTFLDDLDRVTRIRPASWQTSLAYQFDWNPTVEAIGAQGTYLSVGYSESRDMAGAIAVLVGREERVGTVPKRRFLVSAGEWVLDGVRVALEYSRIEDYPTSQRGTGRSANGISSMITMEW